MQPNQAATAFLIQEASALLTRLARVKPFAIQETMVPAAAVSRQAQYLIESFLGRERRKLERTARQFVQGLKSGGASATTPEQMQRTFTLLKMRFNAVLSQFDIFADALTQRSTHETGAWLAGLDVLASETLALPEHYQAPPVICYLDRGHGAAIRRVRTRLPGGTTNPVAIIRVPRERLVGSGIASSLIHEVGHQWSALLGLNVSLPPVLRGLRQGANRAMQTPWTLWERWISEILSDFWSVAQVGITSTLGLIGLVSLPRPFVFRVALDDPHPIPWIRVKLSIAMGQALYPDRQWHFLASLWESLYPRDHLNSTKRNLLAQLEKTLPQFVEVLAQHRPKSLGGKSLLEIAPVEGRDPAHLIGYHELWGGRISKLSAAPPSLAVAVLGQARFNGLINPEEEGKLLSELLETWALRRGLVGENQFGCISGTADSPPFQPII